MLRTCVRVALAALVAATAYVAIPAAPASAAACPTADGVTVVVDFHQLGGGVQTACVADGGGRTASDLFPAAGFPLSYVQRQPGFVCRVQGKPADDPCVNTPPSDAYWALFWSDGKSGSWTYSTIAAGGLHVPDGGYVAFSWNGSSSRAMPGYTPAPHPSPTPTPTSHPTHSAHPSPHSSSAPPASAAPTETASASTSASGDPSKSPKPHHRKSHSTEPSPTPTTESTEPSDSPSASAAAVPTAAEPSDPDGGLPGWVAPAVVVVLFGAVGAAALVRRRRGGPA